VLGGWAPGPVAAADLAARGASYLVVGSDLQALQGGLSALAPSAAPAGPVPRPPGGPDGGVAR
ncbi:MAG: hypothetical protein ACRDYB_02675, partial [Acidimicrobiales bacterium]